MTTFTFGPGSDSRELLVKQFDNNAKRVLEAYDRGEIVRIHTHNEYSEVVNVHRQVCDLRFDGWTFGVSVGEYPKK